MNKRVELLSQIVAQTVLGKIGELQPVQLSESGFFVTRSPSGDINYTRAGAFGKDPNTRVISTASRDGGTQQLHPGRVLPIASARAPHDKRQINLIHRPRQQRAPPDTRQNFNATPLTSLPLAPAKLTAAAGA